MKDQEKEDLKKEMEETQEETQTEESKEELGEESLLKSYEEEIARMQQELEEARAKSEAANDMMLRLAAEMENYKKRALKEQELLKKYANQNLVKELLPVLDNLERALKSASESKDLDAFLEGVAMILKQMKTVLEKEGLVEVKAVGEVFDPNYHEAVAHVPSDEVSENIIIEELQKGYIMHDRVLRPSMVVVSKGNKTS